MDLKIKLSALALVGVLLLTACTAPPQATATLTAVVPVSGSTAEPTEVVETPVVTVEATQTTGMDATATGPAETAAPAATGTGSAAAGMRTFVIMPQESEVSYEVQEQFLNRSLPNMAVGKTNSIEGEVQLSTDGAPTASIPKMTVDLTTLTSDADRRDQAIQGRWLESSRFPQATFVSTSIEGAPQSYTEGEEVAFKLNGDLTIRDVTKPVTFDVTAKLDGDTLTGTGTTHVLMKDFGFDPPNIAGMLTVQDGVTITVNFTAKEQS